MTNKELIAMFLAEIERQFNLSNEKRGLARRSKDYYNEVAYGAQMNICNQLRAFLSDLEKSEKPIIEQYRAWLINEVEKKFEEAKKNFTEACDSSDALRMFDEAEKDAWESVLRWLKELHGYDVTPFENVPMEKEEPVDLEKEIKRYLQEVYDRDITVSDIARHFAKWGAEHSKK